MNRKALNAAKRGAAFLDGRYKNWRSRLNLEQLHLSAGWYEPGNPHSCGCVLAQLDAAYRHDEGDYMECARRLGLSARNDRIRYGFTADQDFDFDELTEAWKRVLA
jgi:hypothetical protein